MKLDGQAPVQCRCCGKKINEDHVFSSFIPEATFFLCKRCFRKIQNLVVQIVEITKTPFFNISDFLPKGVAEKWIERIEKEEALIKA